MSRVVYVNGETMVYVKGNTASPIANISELGLAESPIRVTLDSRYLDVQVDAWGGEIPIDVQNRLSAINVSMSLVHFDPAVLEACVEESMGASTFGVLARAGNLMGGNAPRFNPLNHYIGLNLASPVGLRPWRFYFAYLVGPPMDWPLGTERSVVTLNWRAVPYTQDPWNGGLGASGYVLFDRTLDT